LEFKDYYAALGVERDAKPEDIKKAYRKLARKYHPDVSKEPNADARMKEINEAYAALSDPEKRAAYDNAGQSFQAGQEFRPPPGGYDFNFSHGDFSNAEAADFSDFFSELFGSRMGRRSAQSAPGGGGRAGSFRARGEDQHSQIVLDLADAYSGATRTISLRVPQIDAQGRVSYTNKTIDVRIPKGVYEGQLIRLAGQGTPGIGGGEPGDLYLEVRFKPHTRYRTEGRDVYATLPLAPWEAALGGMIEAPVPDGNVEVRIPEGSQPGRKLRLKGRGIPGAPPGDLYLVLEIALPPVSNPKARELYQTMARELSFFNPRQNLGS